MGVTRIRHVNDTRKVIHVINHFRYHSMYARGQCIRSLFSVVGITKYAFPNNFSSERLGAHMRYRCSDNSRAWTSRRMRLLAFDARPATM